MADTMKQSLIESLTSCPKYIPTWYKYDELGSKLELDCRDTAKNKDYYLYPCMTSCLKSNIQDLVPNSQSSYTLIDLGSGNCSKTRHVIDQLFKNQTSLSFYPLDISKEFLMCSVKKLADEYENLTIYPIADDYVNGIEKMRHVNGPNVILWFNGILNLSYHDQVEMLKLISTLMTDKCHLIFSTDITQDKTSVLKAYDDKTGKYIYIDNDDVDFWRRSSEKKRQAVQQTSGVERFLQKQVLHQISGLHKKLFLNAITRLNREHGSHINTDLFRYVVDFVSDPNMSYVRAYIQAKDNVTFPIPGLGIELEMKREERLYFHEKDTGVSCKYTMGQIEALVKRAGLKLTDTWSDDQKHAVICRCVRAITV
ncbi:uncharacterized protein LOC110465347 [Mizuhopecten yessoensis]|uniref:uncharacterized protein LOC110465347 n=1 Tax=Mizuhopecten yessoensis TaxID=6573 RepID=UPI000B45BB0D|nr:uncharacterized protein LOC110465347 [Mizuhopecten yessoensis]